MGRVARHQAKLLVFPKVAVSEFGVFPEFLENGGQHLQRVGYFRLAVGVDIDPIINGVLQILTGNRVGQVAVRCFIGTCGLEIIVIHIAGKQIKRYAGFAPGKFKLDQESVTCQNFSKVLGVFFQVLIVHDKRNLQRVLRVDSKGTKRLPKLLNQFLQYATVLLGTELGEHHQPSHVAFGFGVLVCFFAGLATNEWEATRTRTEQEQKKTRNVTVLAEFSIPRLSTGSQKPHFEFLFRASDFESLLATQVLEFLERTGQWVGRVLVLFQYF